MKKIIILILNIIFCISSFSHHQIVHKYIVFNGWLALNYQIPGTKYSIMNSRIGHWSDNSYNGTGPWQMGKINTGSYREDEEDIVYGNQYAGTTTITHFWDYENDECNSGFGPDDYKLYLFGLGCYENAYRKATDLWTGANCPNWYKRPTVWIYSAPNITNQGEYILSLSYTNLANVYKYNQIYVTKAIYNRPPYYVTYYNPPIQLSNFNINGGYRTLIENFCWEIVGRICHLIGDAGVPAHTHNDTHASSDLYEDSFIPQYFQTNNWANAIAQGQLYQQNPIIWEPNMNINNPIKYFIYSTNQIADRFPSDDKNGDSDFQYYIENDYYGNLIYPIYQATQTNISCPIQWNECYEVKDKAYVYSMRTTAGFLYYVFNRFGIQMNSPPIISGFTQSPNVIHRGSYGIVKCILSAGNEEGTVYHWRWENAPNGITLSPNSPNNGEITITYSYTDKKNIQPSVNSPDIGSFKVFCKAENQWGMGNEDFYSPCTSTNAGGCPWVFVNNDEKSFEADNNILHKSQLPVNIGNDITDIYKIRVKPIISENGTIAFKIIETGNDLTLIDNLKVKYIDHPIGTIVNTDENNNYIIFDSATVMSTDSANLNGNIITDDIQYHIPSRNIINGDTLDNIFAKYSSSTPMYDAVITLMANNRITPILNKDITNSITISLSSNESYVTMFPIRENPNEIIIPYSSTYTKSFISDVSIDYYRDFIVKYISLANITPINENIFELEPISFWLTNYGEVKDTLKNIDQKYVQIDSTNMLELLFSMQTQPANGYIRDYFIEVTGRISNFLNYDNNYGILPKNKINNKKRFKLYDNYPNPFNPKTTIKFEVPSQSHVEVNIFNVLGQLVSVPINKTLFSGTYNIEFDASNLPSGVYFYQIKSGDYIESKKMILVK